jgi:hypothetical protein
MVAPGQQAERSRPPIRADMTVRQVAVDYPPCRAVLARHGEPEGRRPFGHLEPLDCFVRRRGVSVPRLLAELSSAAGVEVDRAAAAARHAHRPFVVSALAITLSLGAAWGVLLLFEIGSAGRFDAVPAGQVVAHGEAQLWGFVALFILGVALRWLPMALARRPVSPPARGFILGSILAGVVGGFAWALDPTDWPWLGPLSCAALVAGAATFLGIVLRWLAGSLRSSWARFVAAAALWLLAWACLVLYLRLVHRGEGPGAYGLPARLLLIELGAFGLALNAVYGFGLRLLPGMVGSRAYPGVVESAFWAHNAGLLGLAAARLGWAPLPPWVGTALVVLGAVVYVAGLGRLVRVRRFSPRPEQGAPLLARYVQLAFFWLLVGTGMLAGGEVYQAARGEAVPHAWMGAARHALTVGFLTTLILGVGQRLLPILTHTLLAWPRLVLPTLVLIGVGNLWRVGSELLVLAGPAAWRWMPPSAVLELAALGLFAANAVRTLWPPRDPLRGTGRADGNTPVAGLLAEYPWLEDELIAEGVGYLARVRSVPDELTLGTLLAKEKPEPGPTLARVNALLAQRARPGPGETI